MKPSKKSYEDRCRKIANDMKKVLRAPKGMKNPELDHIVAVNFGFTNGISEDVISLPENFVWIPRDENRSKSDDLTDAGKDLLKDWFDRGLIAKPIGQLISDLKTYSFDGIRAELEKHGIAIANDIPLNVAVNLPAVWCQRNETFRWEKTKRAIGHVYLPTHREMKFVVYPDGRIERVDGNTRSHLFRNNLQFADYQVPETILGIFYKVDSREEAELIYHSIDSALTAETFPEKLSGYIRHRGYDNKLPKKWASGASVYESAVVILDGYVPEGETEPVTLDKVSKGEEKAAKTAEKMDYFLDEMVMLGNYINKQNLPKRLTAPLIGMFIRQMLKSKDNKTIEGIKYIADYMGNTGHVQWNRLKHPKYPEMKNLFIMLDEVVTVDDIGGSLNPYIKIDASCRRIIPEQCSNTTANIQDRRVYCGWIAYCFEKFLEGKVMDEDIIFEVTGKRITEKTSFIEADKLIQQARSIVMSKYDNFWKNGLPTKRKST